MSDATRYEIRDCTDDQWALPHGIGANEYAQRLADRHPEYAPFAVHCITTEVRTFSPRVIAPEGDQ